MTARRLLSLATMLAPRTTMIPLAVLALGACGGQMREAREVAVDPFGPIPHGMAEVCVVRPPGHGQLVQTTFRDNGIPVGMTRGPSFFCYVAAPGTHRITPNGRAEAISTLRVEAGKRYILRHQSNVGEDDILWVDPSATERLFSEYEMLSSAPTVEEDPLLH